MYTDQQIQNLVAELSRNLVALFGNAIESAGLSIDNLGDETPDEVVASALVTAHTTAARQAIELVAIFSALPELAGNEAWQTAASRMVSSFSAFIDGVETPGTSVEKLQNVVDFVNALGALPVPYTGTALGDTELGNLFGRADTALTRFEMIDAFRDGDYSRLATTIAMCAVGYAVDAIIVAGLATIGAVSWPFLIIGAGVAWTVSAFFEGEIEEFFQSKFANDEAAFVIEQYTRLYGGEFSNFDSINAVAQVGTAGADISFGLAGRVNLIGGGAGEDLLVGNDLTDVLGGGSGSDTLEGHGGDDILIAGRENDVLIGGVGNDTLEGGDGHDAYRFVSADFADGPTHDVIADIDGLGAITFDGNNIAGGAGGLGGISHASLGDWQTGDGLFRIWISNAGPNQSLILMHRGSGSTIEVRGWQQGEFGISLPQQPDEPEPTGWETTLAGNIGNDYLQLYSPQGQLGNHYIGSAGDDMIYGTNTVRDDLIEGGAGDDLIYGAGGKDQIDGGSDEDQISGFGDESVVHGGDGNDFIAADMSSYVFLFSPDLNVLNLAWSQFRGHLNWERPNEFLSDEDHNLRLFLQYSQQGAFDFTTANFRFEGTWGGIFTIDDLSTPSQDIHWGDMSGSGSDQNTFEIIKGVSLYGDAGDDSISGSAASDFIDGGGDDDLIAGNGGNDVISGGYGEDTIAGGNGSDGIDGGAGDDTIFGEGDADYVSGGDGNDVLRGDGHGDDAAEEGGNDVMFGGTGDDEMHGQGGSDTMFGQDGVDLMLGGAGSDELHGGQDNDELQGGGDADYLYGDEGNDVLFGEAGKDYLHGGTGNDSVYGGEDNDFLHGAEGDDQLSGGIGDDTLSGGSGADHLDGGAGRDSLDGGDGNDQLAGFEDDDVISAGSGDDLANGGAGNDQIDGGLGNDQLDGADGNDVINAGAGNDFVYGGAGNDRIEGGEGNDQLFGREGNDVLLGGQGDDVLLGGVGNDEMTGGAGSNSYFFDRGFGTDVVNLTSGATESVVFQNGIASHELGFSRSGDDLLIQVVGQVDHLVAANFFGQGVQATIRTADGYSYNRAAFEQGHMLTQPTLGGAGGESLTGTGQADRLYGFGGDDILDGGEGDDLLDGGDGNDTLTDGLGSDVMLGGAGDDTMYFSMGSPPGTLDIATGGAGNDIYYVPWHSGVDRITGLGEANSGIDRIVLTNITSSMIANYQILGNDLYLMVGDPWTNSIDNTLVLEGFLRYGAPAHVIEFSDGTTLTGTSFNVVGWAGTSGDDTHVGGFAPDNMNGFDGNDTLSGGAGGDEIDGGNGNDLIHGNEGNDVLYDGGGDDILYGDEDDDQIRATYGGGTDQFRGGIGNDTYYYLSQSGMTNNLPGFTSSEIEESSGEGNDTVYTNYYHFTLSGTEIENLIAETVNYQFIAPSGAPVYRELVGNHLDNTIRVKPVGFGGSNAHYLLDGGAGNDTLYGSNDSDTYVVDSLGDVIVESGSSSSIDTIRTSISYSLESLSGIENIELTSDGTTANGTAGNNQLDGSLATGANTLIGGNGDDTYIIDYLDTVVEAADGGTDKIVIRRFQPGNNTFNVPVGTNVETFQLHESLATGFVLQGDTGNNILIGNTSGNTLRGGGGDDKLIAGGNTFGHTDYLLGEDGNDLLIAGDGYNTLSGGSGDDRIQVNYGKDRVVYDHGEGADRIFVSDVFYAGGTDTLSFGSTIDTDNVIWSRDGNNLVITFVDSAADSVTVQDYWMQVEGVDALSGVIDQFSFYSESGYRTGITLEQLSNKAPVRNYWGLTAVAPTGQSFTYVLPEDAFSDEDVESLVYSLSELPSWLTFDSQTRTFQGTPPSGELGSNIVITATDSFGASASLSLTVSILNVIEGTSGNDALVGTSAPDMLIGLAGNDTLNGGQDADIMVGGAGNDTYTVDNYSDQVMEEVDEGDDLVNTSTSTYDLPENVERLTLTGSAYGGYGNDLDNILTGNSSANYLWAAGGNDTLTGNNGNDDLDGGAGNDTLDGGSGNDNMFGGDGDDTYIVGSTGDYIEEWEKGGIDAVRSSIAYTLGYEVENLVLTGSSGLAGDGNELANVITGNSGANTLRGYDGNDTLDGGTGNDTMIGGVGDDTYVVGVTGDVVTELAGEGEDTVLSAITYTLSSNLERLTLSGTSTINGTGNANGNVLVGNGANNTLSSLAGDDTLEGRAGTDTLTGGVGNDSYVMARTYGTDTAIENDTTAGNTDVARFLAGVAYDQLWFKRPASSNNLEISIIGTTDKLVIKDWYLGAQYRVEEIRTDDGNRVLYAADVQALVTAMAGMTAPAQGQTTLTSGQHATLDPVFNSTWQTEPEEGQRISSSLPASLASPAFATHPAASRDIAGESRPLGVARTDLDGIVAFELDDLWQGFGPYGSGVGNWGSSPDLAVPGMEAHDIYESMTPIATKPLMIPDGAHESDQTRSVSDCQGLIAMMGIADRFDRGAFNPHVNERVYTLIP